MLRLALKSVRHNPKRLILTAIAVALGVMLVTATFTFTNAFSSGFHSLFKEIYSSVDVIVEPDPDSGVDTTALDGQLSATDVERIAAVDGVDVAAAKVHFYGGVLLNEQADAPLKQGPPTLIENVTEHPELDGVTLVDGSWPQGAGDVVLDIDTLDMLGTPIGSEAHVATDAGVKDVTIVGSVRFGDDNNLQTASLMMGTEQTVRDLAGGFSGYQGVSVTVKQGADARQVAAQIDESLPSTMRAISSEDKVKAESESLDSALELVNIFAVAFGLIALFVGAYIIVNTFRIIVTQRTRELGLLRAIGSHGKQVRRMILLEALVVGVLASALGIGAGWLLALAGAAVTEALSGDMFGTVNLPVDAVVWGFGLGTTITLIAAVMPAIHASRISPMEALREASTSGKKPLKLRNVVGSSMTAGGIGLVAVGLATSVTKPWVYVAAGAVLVVLGVTLLAAQVLVPMAFGLRGVLAKLWGVNGVLAANNIRREPRRSANTASALMIGVMLLALVATFTSSIKDTFTSQLGTLKAEMIVQGQMGAIPQGAVDVMADTEGVREVSRFALDSVTVNGTDYSLGTVDTESFGDLVDLKTDTPITEVDGGVFISPTVVKAGYTVGDTVTLEGPQSTLDLVVTGLYDIDGDQDFLVDWETGARLTGDPSILQVLVDFDDAADTATTEELLKDNLEQDYPLVQPQSPGALQDFYNQVLDLVLGVISALLGAALIVAILGVANTLLLSVTERTREIGLLRAVGVKRNAVWSMITLESVVMAVFGTILGIILGTGLGAAVVGALGEYGFERAVIPWNWIGIYTVLSMVAGVVAAVWPAWRASRLDILDAIAADG